MIKKNITPILILLLFVLSIPPAHSESHDNIFLLSYFKDNGQDGVFLAFSEKGHIFTDLNDGKPIFTPPQWENQNLTRDPSIVFVNGMFRMVWTTSWTGQFFGAASSKDLKTWSAPIKVAPFTEWPKDDMPRNVWAPEVHWDPTQETFVIIWSSSTPKKEGSGGHNSARLEEVRPQTIKIDKKYHRSFASITSDFNTFSKAQLFFDPSVSQIDVNLAFDGRNNKTRLYDRWIMAVKHEQYIEAGGKNIRIAYTTDDITKPLPTFRSLIASTKTWSHPTIGKNSRIQSDHMVEGPTLLKYGKEWRIYFDRFDMRLNRFGMVVSHDLINWTDQTHKIEVPSEARHGTVFLAPKSAVHYLR